jgi:hypothetical protein
MNDDGGGDVVSAERALVFVPLFILVNDFDFLSLVCLGLNRTVILVPFSSAGSMTWQRPSLVRVDGLQWAIHFPLFISLPSFIAFVSFLFFSFSFISSSFLWRVSVRG